LIWFAPVLPCVGTEVEAYLSACRRCFASFGFDFYVAMLMLNPRAVICLMSIMYDADDAAEAMRAESLLSTLIADMQVANYEPYRAGLLAWTKMGAAAPGATEVNNRLKSVLDPSDVLAPGRYGLGRTTSPDQPAAESGHGTSQQGSSTVTD
jgi:4-cresol dehydrogenase (hydroxylating)